TRRAGGCARPGCPGGVGAVPLLQSARSGQPLGPGFLNGLGTSGPAAPPVLEKKPQHQAERHGNNQYPKQVAKAAKGPPRVVGRHDGDSVERAHPHASSFARIVQMAQPAANSTTAARRSVRSSPETAAGAAPWAALR